jgi:uncharacterized lipoprotein YmbA
MYMMRRMLLTELVALAGCSSPSPALYTLSAVPGTPQPGGPRWVVLREISLARYLEREQIVRSSEGNRLDVRSNDWWGEPLGSMLSRVLVENLSQRLPGSGVLSEFGAITSESESIVELNIQRMDAGSDGMLVLLAQISVGKLRGRRNSLTRSSRITVPLTGPDTQSLVVAMSTATGQLADAIAEMLRGLR